jgi:inosine-uridine nucleoside N-ribohydrolase
VLVTARALAVVAALGCAAHASAQEPLAVWIDTDPAMGEPQRDVDDGMALIQAFRSPELRIRGISVVGGNAPLDRGLPIARRLVEQFAPAPIPVHPGAASAAALGREPLTVLAIGPVTNVATVVQRHPELAARMTRIIAVAGRRPGQRFTTGATNSKGHRDFNFELDPGAFRVLLASGVPLVLAPFEISSQVWIEPADLDRLAAGPPAARAVAEPARRWLGLWRQLFGVEGFNPFDTLAVGYAISPSGFTCEDLPIEIRTLPDDVTEPGMQGTSEAEKPYLLVSAEIRGPAPRARYCSTAPSGFKQQLLERLLR